mgnify:CR=1 FL=1
MARLSRDEKRPGVVRKAYGDWERLAMELPILSTCFINES